jgi:hypothetical protein
MKYLDRRGVIFFLVIDALLVTLAVSSPFLRRDRSLIGDEGAAMRMPGIRALYGE